MTLLILWKHTAWLGISLLTCLGAVNCRPFPRDNAFVGWIETAGSIATNAQDNHLYIRNPSCLDKENEIRCKEWVDQGECTKNPGFMAESCKQSCALCSVYIQRSEHYGKNITFSTPFGEIGVTLLWDKAPLTCHLVYEIAKSHQLDGCKFYRNEAIPTVGTLGPPYGLLQGVCPGLKDNPPKEVSTPIRRGHVASIHPGKDFYISLMDHVEWSSAHTTWGVVEDLGTVDKIVGLPYAEHHHPQYGTVMRMMSSAVHFTLTGNLLDRP